MTLDHWRMTFLVVGAGNGNVLRDRNSHEVDYQQESVYDAEELEGGAIKVRQEDGETEREEQAGDQSHEGQPFTEFMGRFLPD
jgi:hypothetical protein